MKDKCDFFLYGDHIRVVHNSNISYIRFKRNMLIFQFYDKRGRRSGDCSSDQDNRRKIFPNILYFVDGIGD